MAVPDRHHRWWEWATALCTLVPAVLVRGAGWPGFLLGLGEQAVATALILLLRTRPVIGFGAILAVAAQLRFGPSPWPGLVALGIVPWLGLAVALATVYVLEEATSPGELRLAAVLTAGYAIAVGLSAGEAVLLTVAGAVGPVLGGVCIVLGLRLYRARNDRIEASHRERAAAARQDEREQLAAALHDTLGRQLTLLVMAANTLAMRTAEAPTRTAAEHIAGLGAGALGELRTAVQALGSERRATGSVVLPESPQIAVLIGEAQAAGQSVTYTGDDPALPPPTADALRRCAQEALTNAARHAPGATVHVTLHTGDGQATLDVENTASDQPALPAGAGTGLVSLGRRITLLGGSLDAGPAGGGGWRMRVTLPAGTP